MKTPDRLAWLWGAIVCLLAVHNIYLFMSDRLAPESDILALLPVQERDPVLQQAVTQAVASTQQRLVVLVGGGDWQDARRAADAYLAVVAQQGGLLRLDRRMDPAQEDGRFFAQHRLILLTAADAAALKQQPQEYWVERALAGLYSPFGAAKAAAWQDDPFGLFGAWLQARVAQTPVRPRDGQLFVSDGARDYVVLPFTLGAPAFSMAAQEVLTPLLERARVAAQTAVPQAQVLAAGVVRFAAAAGAQAKWEVSTIGLGSTLGIALLIWLTFRSLKPIVWIMLSIGVGCLGALSVCWLLFDRIHLLTLVFGASLIGGAQDYGSYFLCNRLTAQGKGLDSWQLLRCLLPALVLALVTTVVGYLALALTPFPGLQQMAVFSALGLIFAWLTVICWFPSLVRRDAVQAGPAATWVMKRLARSSSRAAGRLVPGLIGVMIVAALAGLWRLEVRDDIRLLQSAPAQLLRDQLEVSRLLAAPAPAQFYLVRGAGGEEVLQREESLTQRLDALIERQIIDGYAALSDWVPSLHAQAHRRGLIEQRLLDDNGALAAVAQRIGADAGWIRDTRARLLAASAPLTPADFFQTAAGDSVRHLWLGESAGGGYAGIVALRGARAGSLPELQRLGGNSAQWVDTVGEISLVLGRYRKTMSWVIVLSYFAVYALLYRRYGSIAWRVLAPIALASLATVGFLGLTGQSFHLFHVLALLLLLGIGVDYGIFFYDHPSRVDPVGWLAVGLSALSTLLSFGLLGLSQTPALQAFGWTMLLGTIAVCLLVPCFAQERATTESVERSAS